MIDRRLVSSAPNPRNRSISTIIGVVESLVAFDVNIYIYCKGPK